MAAMQLALLLPLALLSGALAACTPTPDPAPAAAYVLDEPRDPQGFPWDHTGITPTADSIRLALSLDVVGLENDPCPFRLAPCADGPGPTGFTFQVANVACRPVERLEDSCRFDLVERRGGATARSRCEARFEIVGTSHDPMRWGVAGDDDADIRCRRQR
jgi:hypothetical protein